jgi:small subunit ribosomal protein S1
LRDMQGGQSPIVTGTVTDIRDYGAFVDIGGGTEGFVHVSELSHTRVANIKDFLQVGEQVKAKVVSIEEEPGNKTRISLSLKAALDDPWTDIQNKLKMGETYKARVTKIEKFGAFVAVEHDFEGLIPISEMSWTKRINHPSEILSVDQLVNVRVLNINTADRKLSFSLKDLDADPWFEIEKKFPVGSHHRGKVTHLKEHGALVNFAEGLSGLLPMSTLKAAYGVGYRKHASPPKEIEVAIAKIDKAEKKILLNIWNFENPEDDIPSGEAIRAMAERAAAQSKNDDGKKIGTLGMLLAKKMEKKV